MRKLFTMIALGAMALSASAQKSYVGNKFFDNWSISLQGGGVTTLTGSNDIQNTSKAWTSSSILKGARPMFGLELTKAIIPSFSLSLQDHAAVNWTDSQTAVDYNDLALLGKVNLMNFFGGYNGTPRFFEIETYAGVGWRYYFNHNCNYVNNADVDVYNKVEGSGTGNAADVLDSGRDSFLAKAGVNFLFNLGEKKAWTLELKPAIIWDLDGFSHQNGNGARFDKNWASMELSAGLTYHFKSSNDAHHFTIVTPRDQAEVDGLNAQVNDLRGQVADKDAELDAANRQIADLQNQLNDARNRKPIVKEVVKAQKEIECIVSFRFDKSVIDASQMPNVIRAADYLKLYKNAKIVIKGYCSPEGTTAYNQALSVRRANSVKNCLVKRFGIAADRIETSGHGVGKIFAQPSWNRVCICTLIEE